MSIASQMRENKLRKLCAREYLEQMKWTYLGEFGTQHLPSKDNYISSTGYAHIKGVVPSLKPLYEFLMEREEDFIVETRLANFEVELLLAFCSQAEIDGYAVIEFINSDAKRFAKENFEPRESWEKFTESTLKRLGNYYLVKSWYWREQIMFEWLELEANSRKSNHSRNQGASEVKSKSKSTYSNNPSVVKVTKEPKGKPIVEVLNSEKIWQPTQKRQEATIRTTKMEQKNTSTKKNSAVKRNGNTVSNLSDARSKKLFAYLKSELASEDFDPREIFTSSIKGWSWLCEVHGCYGVGRTEDDVLNMAGSHIYYEGQDGKECEIFTRDLSF